MNNIKPDAEQQRKAEHKRFLARQKGKPVLADRIKSKEERELRRHQKQQDEGKEKRYVSEL